MPEDSVDHIDFEELNKRSISHPIVTHLYTADPSAHVFNNKIFIYPSHDIDAGDAFDDLGSHFAMKDYHVLSMEDIGGKVTDHGVALDVENVPWAERQMWAPDANEKDGKYYLFFPAKDYKGVFRIGVAISDKPQGPFTPMKDPIAHSFSIDPAVFKDDDGSYYMYFGGIWGGQLQRWRTGIFNSNQPDSPTAFLPDDDEPALLPYVAKMSDDLLEFIEIIKNTNFSFPVFAVSSWSKRPTSIVDSYHRVLNKLNEGIPHDGQFYLYQQQWSKFKNILINEVDHAEIALPVGKFDEKLFWLNYLKFIQNQSQFYRRNSQT